MFTKRKYFFGTLLVAVVLFLFFGAIRVSASSAFLNRDSAFRIYHLFSGEQSFFRNHANVAQSKSGTFSACDNMDVVFVVDQSNSMSLPGIASDPLSERKYAVASMIELLTDLAVDECADSSYRVAVISFGDKGSARIDLPLSNINPNTVEEAKALREKYTAALKADQLGQTYPLDALSLAYRIFRDASTFGDAPRKRVIIFLTDGLPCVGDNLACLGKGDPAAAAKDVVDYFDKAFPFNPVLLQSEQCLNDLRSKYGDDIPQNEINHCEENISADKKGVYYAESTYVYMILLRSDISYPRDVLEQFDAMTKSHAGAMIELKRNLSEVPTTMRQILSKLVGVQPNLLECGSPFAVNPYLKKLRVNVYNISEDNAIILSYVDANGETHEIQAGESTNGGFTLDEPYYTYGVNERYVFSYPYPGLWRVTAENCSGVDIYVEAIEFNQDVDYYIPNLPDKIPQYDIEPYYSSDDPYYLEYQMKVGDTVVPQAEPSLFAIDAILRVTEPSGKNYSIPMEYHTDEQKFVAKSPLLVPEAGTYHFVLAGTTKWHLGDFIVKSTLGESQVFNETYELFHFEGTFEVYEVTPFVVYPVSPKPDSTIYHAHQTLWQGGWPLKYAPLQVRVRIANRDGTPLTGVDSVFLNDGAITAQVLSPCEGNQCTITLVADTDKPGEYIGEFQPLDYEGDLTIQYTVHLDSVSSDYRPDNSSVSVHFTRADGFWHRKSSYFLLLAALFVAMIVFIVYNILIRTNKVSGSLEFVDGNTTIAEFGLYSGKNKRIIGKRELDDYPQLGLKKMIVYNIPRESRTSEDGFLDEMDNVSGIRVDCIDVDGRKFSVDLYPEMPTPYSDIGLGMMSYKPVE